MNWTFLDSTLVLKEYFYLDKLIVKPHNVVLSDSTYTILNGQTTRGAGHCFNYSQTFLIPDNILFHTFVKKKRKKETINNLFIIQAFYKRKKDGNDS